MNIPAGNTAALKPTVRAGRKLAAAAIVCYFAFFLAVLAGCRYYRVFIAGAVPVQPIAFSHKIHLSKVGLNCSYCHEYAGNYAMAGAPPMKTCVACHETAAAERPEIKKLMSYWDRNESIPWVKIYSLPDHVYFTHKRHVKAGVSCFECHGDVAAMDTVRKASSLKMGWCVSCHRVKNATVDCLVCHK